MERTRIRTHIRGFDESIGGGFPEGHVVLVSGAPGTMKSSFAFHIAYRNALDAGVKAAYFTLEQSRDRLVEQMATLGMEDPKAFESLSVMDMGNLRKNLSYLQGRGTWLELFKMYCNNIMKAGKVHILVVDSLDVLDTMAKMQDRRQELYFLFEWLRDLGPLTLLVSEKPLDSGPTGTAPDEAYLADGIIELLVHPTAEEPLQRRIRVVKMRGTRHDMGYNALHWDPAGFEVSRALSGTA